jgi:uncharacterized protein YyaL (SSP411 family)
MMESTGSSPRFTNRLIRETSPYLLQHAHNPVDWYPWGEEALTRAREEDLPILLSIGYSACHWCHVMEHESFESEPIARLMNDNYVCIKVDREERPDLDGIYMNAVQMMTGHGGWPMTVFLTPDGRPFYGGTYFPPVDRQGMPGFPRLLIALAEAWRERRDEIEKNAGALLLELGKLDRFKGAEVELDPQLLEQSATRLLQALDREHGGFGNRPKFPPAMALSFLMRRYRRTGDPAILAAIELTLDKMARGGIYDQLGGGFHRYSVDERWLVPHFEKMLYDNALLARLYLDGWLLTGRPLYRRITEETLDYVVREMTDPGGGFYSTQDADSEGVEGRFFVWTPAEVRALLGEEEGRLFCQFYDITEEGNFEDCNILHVDQPVEVRAPGLGLTPERLEEILARGRAVLFEAREARVKPGRDEKMLTSWNGLMLRSFAEAARVLERPDYLEVAIRNAGFVLANLRHDGRLLRTHKDGESRLNGYLEDYTDLIDGLLALYHATFDDRWFREALDLSRTMIDLFRDEEEGGFFFTSRDHEKLITRAKDFYDNATPGGNSVAAEVLIRLSLYTGDHRYRDEAERILRLVAGVTPRMPSGFGHLLGALDLFLSTPAEIAVVGDPASPVTARMLQTIFSRYLPGKVVALARPGSTPDPDLHLLDGRPAGTGPVTAYVCQNFRCLAPVTSPEDLQRQLAELDG